MTTPCSRLPLPASQTLVAANREQYDLLRDGVSVTFRNDKGERVR